MRSKASAVSSPAASKIRSIHCNLPYRNYVVPKQPGGNPSRCRGVAARGRDRFRSDTPPRSYDSRSYSAANSGSTAKKLSSSLGLKVPHSPSAIIRSDSSRVNAAL